MSEDQTRHWNDGLQLVDVPAIRDEIPYRQDDHTGHENYAKGKAEPEPPQGPWHLDEEIGEFECLRGGAPGHVDLEHVREQGLGDVNGYATQEDKEHEKPFEVFEERRQERA